MSGICDNDFFFPLKVDVYYPVIGQNDYGQIVKEWVFNRTEVCNAERVNNRNRKDAEPDAYIHLSGRLIARTKTDLRFSSQDGTFSMMNILVANIRDRNDNLIFTESAGPRAGRGTLYEIATLEPFQGPFGNTDYFHMLWIRTESQDVDDR